jgi:hypothetical protein
MIGFRALLGELLGVTVVSAFCILIAVSLWRSAESGKRKDPLALCGVAIFGGIALLLAFSLAGKINFVRELRSLRGSDVRHLMVNSSEIDDPEEKAAWVLTLNRVEYFAPEHGGWTDSLPVRIETARDRTLIFSEATYSRAPGVVLISPGGRYAFSPVIPPRSHVKSKP